MKLLVDQKAATYATLNGTAESPNYPTRNLVNQILEYKTQWAGGSETITFTFDSNVTMDCLFYGYTDVYAMTIRRYLATVLIDTTVVATVYANSGVVYFDSQEVDEVQIDVSGTYLGGVDFGVCVDIGTAFINTDKPAIFNALQVMQSSHGQNLPATVRDLEVRSFSLPGRTLAQLNTIIETFKDIPKGANFWIDVAPDDRDRGRPLYCHRPNDWSTGRTYGRYSFNFDIMESR